MGDLKETHVYEEEGRILLVINNPSSEDITRIKAIAAGIEIKDVKGVLSQAERPSSQNLIEGAVQTEADKKTQIREQILDILTVNGRPTMDVLCLMYPYCSPRRHTNTVEEFRAGTASFGQGFIEETFQKWRGTFNL